MVSVNLPSMLASQAGGQRRFEVDAGTVGDVLRALPVADLVLDAAGACNPWLLVYVDEENARDLGGLECPLQGAEELRIIAILAGG